jgi:hypothetical protein
MGGGGKVFDMALILTGHAIFNFRHSREGGNLAPAVSFHG